MFVWKETKEPIWDPSVNPDKHMYLFVVQVLKDAMYKLPYVDTYYHKRDHSLMVVLHNPHNPEYQNHEDWHTELHSNLGFR